MILRARNVVRAPKHRPPEDTIIYIGILSWIHIPVKSEFWRWRVSLRSAKRPQPIISEPFSNNREVETKKWRRKVENEVRWGGPPDK